MVYKKYEPDARMLLLHLVCLVFIPVVPGCLILSKYFNHIILALAVSFVVFHISLLSSIVIYRLSPWHPLASYPGPIIARVSMLWTAYTVMSGKSHEYRKMLHDRYGPYVRTGELVFYLKSWLELTLLQDQMRSQFVMHRS